MAHALRQGLGGGLRGLRLAGGAIRNLSGKSSVVTCGQLVIIFHSATELLNSIQPRFSCLLEIGDTAAVLEALSRSPGTAGQPVHIDVARRIHICTSFW